MDIACVSVPDGIRCALFCLMRVRAEWPLVTFLFREPTIEWALVVLSGLLLDPHVSLPARRKRSWVAPRTLLLEFNACACT